MSFEAEYAIRATNCRDSLLPGRPWFFQQFVRRNRQKKSGKILSRLLRAELRHFGYMDRAGGLLIKIDVMVDIDEELVIKYL